LSLIVFSAWTTTVAWSQEEDIEGWPREIDTAKGLVVIYQPQLDRFEGNAMEARAAVSITPKSRTEPVFGAVWLKAHVATDFDTRTVEIVDVQVPKVKFPDATEEQEQEFSEHLAQQIPTWDLSLSLDRLLAMLDLADTRRMVAEGFDDKPPKIELATYPAILVTIDGQPQIRDVEGTNLKHVVNTPFLIILDPERGGYYLYAGNDQWYAATQVTGPWQITASVPAQVAALAPIEEEQEAEREAQAIAEEEGVAPEPEPTRPPAIIVATEPTELIVTDGDPKWGPLEGNDLLYVTNTESDIILEVATQRYFVLLSGRWFVSKSLDGPWAFAPSDDLPAAFAEIPAESEMGHLRTWVAGTDEANEAVAEASIPQTAAIKRDATIEVTYDGNPTFEKIEGTELDYAVNTSFQVLRYGKTYYCVDEGVWYEADNPLGPWKVAIEIPDEIQKIPPSSPGYNVKYVYIYDHTPEVVYVGYYPGYTYGYVYHACVVYGTGWYYRPWWGTYYYPRPATWGFHVRWNPWRGWGFGFSYSTGRFTFGIGFGGWGRWYRGGWWGPRGYRGYRRGYNRGWNRGYRAGARAGYRAGNRNRNIYNRQNNARRNAAVSQSRSGQQPRASTTRQNNVAADRNGNVAQRNQSGNWQSRAGSSPSSSTQQSLNRTQNARQNGATRTRNARRSTGGRRGGGRRR
jgi:hypothetical protein